MYQDNFSIKCCGDINSIEIADVPEHDVLCTGFSCQPFSKTGGQRGLKDKGRGDLIHPLVEIIRARKPRYFILENVPNLKSRDNGSTWQYIINLLTLWLPDTRFHIAPSSFWYTS